MPRRTEWSLVLVCMLGAFPVCAATRVVQLDAEGPVAEVGAFTASLREWLTALDATLSTEAIESPDARVHVEWNEATCTIEVFRGRDGLVRRRSLDRVGAPEVVTESAVLLAHAGLEEVFREPTKMVEVVTSTPSPLPQPEVVTPSLLQLSFGAFLQGRSYDERAPVLFGAGAESHLALQTSVFHPSLTVLGNYQGPLSHDERQPQLNLQLQVVSVRLLPGVERRFGTVTVGLEAGGGFDVLIAQTTLAMNAEKLERTDVAPFLSAALSVRWHFTQVTALFARVLVDFDPAPRRYTVGPHVVLDPWSVRPAVQLGVSFDLPVGAR